MTIPPDLDRATLEETLKQITIDLIAAHKASNHSMLFAYAQQARLPQAEFEKHPGKLFMRLVQTFHPDRIESFVERVAVMVKKDDQNGLASLQAELVIQSQTKKTRGAGPPSGGSDAAREAYVFRPSDFGFAEHKWAEYDTRAEVKAEPRTGRRRHISIVEAVRRVYFGNLELQLTRADLEELDGDLELYDMDIGDLEGIQLCRRLEGLNLSINHIHELDPLRPLRHLVTLDLSNNRIEEADCLAALTKLEELDLSENEIEDIAFLEKLTRLRVVNLSGNPIAQNNANDTVLEILKTRGVLVI